jgi:hypothetical protein
VVVVQRNCQVIWIESTLRLMNLCPSESKQGAQ